MAAVQATRGKTQHTAFQRAVRLETREVTRRLNAALGGTLVSALAGSRDAKLSRRWAKEGGPSPRPEAARKLHFAYEQWTKLTEAEGEHVARVWFIGANPLLDYDTPINAIREGHLKQVSIAADALVNDTFSG